MHVRAAERLGSTSRGWYGRNRHLVRLERSASSRISAWRAPKPTIGDREVVEVAQERCRADEVVEVLRVADVARVHDDEPVDEPLFARPGRCHAAPATIAVVSTQFGITVIRSGARPLRHEPLAHPLADRDDVVGALEVVADQPPQDADEHRVRQPSELGRRSPGTRPR